MQNKKNENGLFEFLEKKREELYKLENKNIKLKTTNIKIEMLKEIYNYCGFNFQRTAYLTKRETKNWKHSFKYLKKNNPKRPDSEIAEILIRTMKTCAVKKLKNYDVLKIRNTVYNMENIKRL